MASEYAVDLSIVVVSYNTREMLRGCLDSIVGSSDPAVAVEVVVVDNGSCDGSASMVEHEFPTVRVIANGENRGFAAACNQGIASSSGRYVMLLNSDALVLPTTISRIVAFMHGSARAGAVGCKLVNPDGSLQPSILTFPGPVKDAVSIALKGVGLKSNARTRARLAKVARLLPWGLGQFDDHIGIKEIDYPRGACITLRREALAQVGLLDERFFFTGEEMDWCYRAKRHGWLIYYYPEAVVVHYDHGASRGIRGKVFVQTRKSALLFYEKHCPRWRTTSMKALVSAVLMLNWLAATLRLLGASHDKQTLRAQREVWWSVVRLHYDSGFRALNVLCEMGFRYN